MENSIDYINHVNIVKDLKLYTTLRDNQKPIEDDFEEIYTKAKDADVKLGTSKEFLNSLSTYELSILRKFDGLVDTIDVDKLTNEGAYNLIVHDWEEYDFNNDGLVSVGIGEQLANIPRQMDDEAKKVWVKTLNSMDMEKDFMSITVLDVIQTVTDIINQDGHESSPQMIESTKRLKEAMLIAYEDVKEEAKLEQLSTQKELEIKQELINKANEEKEEPLVVAIEVSKTETRTPEEIIAEYRAMPGQAGIFYEGMFEEQKAAALAKHEPYFIKEYKNYEKYKDIFIPIYSNYTTQKANDIGKELNAQFPEFGAMREKAYMGGTEADKVAFEDMFWDYQAYNKYLREKYDMDMSAGGFMASTKKSSKAYNYAVYDSLESGMSIEEATKKAQSLLSYFGGREAQSFSLMFFSGLPEDIEAATEIPKEDIDYDKQIDLRDYGFEHNFWSDAYLNTYGNDSVGVKSRIMYEIELYSFLLENEDVIDSKLAELKDRAYETDNGKDWYDWQNDDEKFNDRFKSQFQSKYDNAVYAKEIYDKYGYKIFN